MRPALASLPSPSAPPRNAELSTPPWRETLRLLALWLALCALMGSGLWRPVERTAVPSLSTAPFFAAPAAAPQLSLAKVSGKQQGLDSKECWTLHGTHKPRASFTYTLSSSLSCAAEPTPPLRRPGSRAPPRLLSLSV